MIIKPRIRGFICTNAHPEGCHAHVHEQISYTRSLGDDKRIRNALVVGCSGGYGLASRIVATFGFGANSMGISFEREPTASRTASAGWYNNLAFDRAAQIAGVQSSTINADAFADTTKDEVVALLKEQFGSIDLLVYSLASPLRRHPRTGITHRSTILPVGSPHKSKTLALDFPNRAAVLKDVAIDPATDEEIADTVVVMGGEDWQMWVNRLADADLVTDGFKTISFTYLGNELTYPIYRGGTLGRAKEDLDRTCRELNSVLGVRNASAQVAVLKAVVTQASTAIPVVPLYFSILFDVMKQAGNHEGTIEHINRLFREQLYSGSELRTDDEGRIRMDNYEELPEIQNEVLRRWQLVTQENVHQLADVEGFVSDFMRLFGFEINGVDYELDVDPFGEEIHL